MLPAGAPLSDWLTWLESLSPHEIDMGLERVEEVLGRLDLSLPEHVLIIAGTNGKGSSVAMADALLRAAGYTVGVYTSPHIIDYNERIALSDQSGGRRLAGDQVCSCGRRLAGDQVCSCGRRLAGDAEIIEAFTTIESVRNDVPLTYFEYGTLAAFLVFARAELDVWILEVGMGGRLDATNVIDPTGVLITNVALDHCEWLGDDVETIAREKAGVMRPGVPAVFGSADVPSTIVSHAEETGAQLLLAGRDFTSDGVPQPGLAGAFQVENAAAVLALLRAAGLGRAAEEDLVQEVLPLVGLAGRGQYIEAGGNQWLLDVAHNPAAAKVLATTLQADTDGAAAIAIVAMLFDKDVEGIAASLDSHVDLWIATAADSHRSIPPRELARRIANTSGRPCLIAEDLDAALQSARRAAARNDKILVTGSFYVVGPVLQYLESLSQS